MSVGLFRYYPKARYVFRTANIFKPPIRNLVRFCDFPMNFVSAGPSEVGNAYRVKTPHRAMELSTLNLEVGLKWATQKQKSFFGNGIKKFFGGHQVFRQIASFRRKVYSDWTLFLQKMRGMVGDWETAWGNLRKMRKDCLSEECRGIPPNAIWKFYAKWVCLDVGFRY